jgi:hypothetical protein
VLKVSIKLGLGLAVIAAMSSSSLAQSPVGTLMLGRRRKFGHQPGPGNIDGVNNAPSDPSGLRNSLKVAAPLPPSISAVATYH